MKINEQIRAHRKTAGLTQEQAVAYLGVSASAVNKWERGNTYPDITLLPVLARLLKMDMNTLFSFEEELTDFELSAFLNQLVDEAMNKKFFPGTSRQLTVQTRKCGIRIPAFLLRNISMLWSMIKRKNL